MMQAIQEFCLYHLHHKSNQIKQRYQENHSINKTLISGNLPNEASMSWRSSLSMKPSRFWSIILNASLNSCRWRIRKEETIETKKILPSISITEDWLAPWTYWHDYRHRLIDNRVCHFNEQTYKFGRDRTSQKYQKWSLGKITCIWWWLSMAKILKVALRTY